MEIDRNREPSGLYYSTGHWIFLDSHGGHDVSSIAKVLTFAKRTLFYEPRITTNFSRIIYLLLISQGQFCTVHYRRLLFLSILLEISFFLFSHVVPFTFSRSFASGRSIGINVHLHSYVLFILTKRSEKNGRSARKILITDCSIFLR